MTPGSRPDSATIRSPGALQYLRGLVLQAGCGGVGATDSGREDDRKSGISELEYLACIADHTPTSRCPFTVVVDRVRDQVGNDESLF